jgi:hypothetical protein
MNVLIKYHIVNKKKKDFQKKSIHVTRFGLCPFIRPAFIGWDCLAVKFSGARWLASRPTLNLEDQDSSVRVTIP